MSFGTPCARCCDPYETMPFRNRKTREVEFLCTACCTGTNGFLGQEQGPEDAQYVGEPRNAEWGLVECVIYLRSDAPEEDRWLHATRFDLLQQWGKIQRLVAEHGWSRFHALIDYDDCNPFDLEFLFIMCRKNPHIPLVVASTAILPFGADLSGVRVVAPVPRSRAEA